MDKILLALAALGIGVGIFFFPRAARGTEIPVSDPSEPVPQGSSPLGLRNNNPFNLEYRPSIQWRGQIGTDGRFAIFDTDLNGLRAGMINIHTKFTRDGIRTVRRLINVLSPPVENPTEDFVTFVANRLGVAPEQPLNFEQHIIPLSKAIVTFENAGNPFPDSLYRQALEATGRV